MAEERSNKELETGKAKPEERLKYGLKEDDKTGLDNRKNIVKLAISIVVVIFIIVSMRVIIQDQEASITKLSERVKVLEEKDENEEISRQTSENETDYAEMHQSDYTVNDQSEDENYETYLSELFSSDGTIYKPKKQLNDMFYSDFNLKTKIKNPKFCSKEDRFVGLNQDEIMVYSYRLANGRICYSCVEGIEFEKSE